MGRHLFKILLFTGVVHLILSVPRKYYLIPQGKTWNDARTFCQANHEDLAVITSDDNLIRLQRLQFSANAWIGIYYDWRWSLGNEPIGSVALWATGQPDNLPDEKCGAVDIIGWLDTRCDQSLPFVCFDGRNSGDDRYIYYPTAKSWNDAQSYCRQLHTDLASARDQTELSIIQLKTNGYFSWIGMVRDSWKWTDGTTLPLLPWMPGKPDNALGNEDCVYLDNSQASDAQCTDVLPFFCYSIITGKKQLLRLKVVSSQNLNDPAVLAAILEKLKQKMLDNGMTENVSLKWRKQHDGLVFHKEKKEILV